MRTPISCSLELADARTQLGEWRETLRAMTQSSERVSANRWELSLFLESDVEAVIELARREVKCCPFFSFSLEIGAEHLVFAVDVPDDAIAILDLLVSDAA